MDNDNEQQPDAPTPPPVDADAPVVRDYFFPQYLKTVSATSLEDAEAQLATLLAADNQPA